MVRKTIKKRIRRKDGVVQRYDVVPVKIQKQIYDQKLEDAAKELKTKGRVRLPKIGILRLKVQKAKPARWGTNPFSGEKMRFKAKPKRKKCVFRAAKELQQKIK